MSESFNALPGTLNISLTTGDEFGMLADLDIDTTGFTWTAIVYETSTTVSFVNPGGVSTQGTTAATFTVTVVNAAAGQVNLSLTEVQTAALNPATTYRWYLRGVSSAMVTRTYLSGTLRAYAP
jgi:predicted secreted protein